MGATRAVSRNNINVALDDLCMPGLSGDRLVNVLRCNSRARELVIVVVSSSAPEELERIEREVAEADVVLHKNDVDRLLLPLLGRLLARSGVQLPERLEPRAASE